MPEDKNEPEAPSPEGEQTTEQPSPDWESVKRRTANTFNRDHWP